MPERGAFRFIPHSVAHLTSAVMLLAAALFGADAAHAAGPVSARSEAAAEASQTGGKTDLVVVVEIDEGWHINSSSPTGEFLIPTTLELEPTVGLLIDSVEYPSPVIRKLPFSGGAPLELYEGTVRIAAKLRRTDDALGAAPVVFLRYQACTDTSCRPPESIQVAVSFQDAATTGSPGTPDVVRSGVNDAEAGRIADLVNRGFWVIPGMILLGLALNLTPCVYPLVSITVAYFGGQAGDNRARKLWLAILYALGIAVTFSIVGVSAALSGGLFGAALAQPPVLIGMAAMMVALALSSFGLYQIKIPDALGAKLGGSGGGAVGALVMGMTMGLVAAPCVGPVVVGLLVFVSSQADPLLGLWLFSLLAVGLGLPYVVLAVAAGSISVLPRSGAWLEWTEHLFGCVLLAMAIYFVQPLLPDAVEHVLMPGFIAVALIYLAFIDPAGSKIPAFLVGRRVFGTVALAALAFTHLPSGETHQELAFEPFTAEAYDRARTSGQPFVVEFSAEWCLPCKEMEERTFTDPDVVGRGTGITFITVDMTTSTGQIDRILDSFEVFGAPTTLFFGPDGKEWKRKVGFIGPEEFAELLDQSRRPPAPAEGQGA